MTTLSIKTGATFRLLYAITQDDGTTAVDLTGTTLASQVRDPYGTLIADLPITNTGTTGVVSITQATTAWPTGLLSLDLKLTDGTGTVLISDTASILVSPAVTK